MSWNQTGFNVTPFNQVRISTYTFSGIIIFQCANWAEGPTHGGVATTQIVTTMWDYISNYENVNGNTDYRKVFIENYGNQPTGSCVIRPGFIAPNDLIGILNTQIALATSSDSMSNRPADNMFGSGLSTSIPVHGTIPVWIKRTINAGGANVGSYLGVVFTLTISNT
jgi:hypothetical protein